jgi:hypothetical protein
MTDPAPTACPTCGAAASGKFCSNCGAPLGPRACGHCGAQLSAQARFCHRCGRPAAAGGVGAAPTAAARPNNTPWLVAGAIIALGIGGIVYKVSRETPGTPAAPDMANAGQQSAAPFAGGAGPFAGGDGAPAGRAPDISRMSPRERFDRLFNRIMSASERGDSNTVVTFTPMALGAYSQLDTVDTDARYHAAVLHLQVGDVDAASALADTILKTDPGHLFGYVIRGTVAQIRKDPRARAQADKDFLAHYDAEMQKKRVEYLDHKPVLDQFKEEAAGRK